MTNKFDACILSIPGTVCVFFFFSLSHRRSVPKAFFFPPHNHSFQAATLWHTRTKSIKNILYIQTNSRTFLFTQNIRLSVHLWLIFAQIKTKTKLSTETKRKKNLVYPNWITHHYHFSVFFFIRVSFVNSSLFPLSLQTKCLCFYSDIVCLPQKTQKNQHIKSHFRVFVLNFFTISGCQRT